MKLPSNRALAVISVTFVVASLAYIALRDPLRDVRGGPAMTGAPASTTGQALPPRRPLAEAAARAVGPLPASLVGTHAPGVRADADGNLVIEPALRDLFEYFLSALGEEDLEAISARLAAHLRSQLPPAAADRAWQVFNDYLGYRAALSGQPAVPLDDLAVTRARLDDVAALRRAQLGNEVADAFFAAEEAYDRYTLESMLVQRDASLDDSARAARIAALEAALPPALLAARREATAIGGVAATVDRLRAAGASEADVYAARTEALGPEAAERLAALDQEEARWKVRYDDYRRQRAAIIAAPGLSDGDREQQVEALRARLFDEQEILRVRALDATATQM